MFANLAAVVPLLVALSASPPRPPAKGVKEAVFVVRPHYHENTRQMFKELGQLMNDLAHASNDEESAARLRALSGLYMAHAESAGHGTGWLVIDPDGAAWVSSRTSTSPARPTTCRWNHLCLPRSPSGGKS